MACVLFIVVTPIYLAFYLYSLSYAICKIYEWHIAGPLNLETMPLQVAFGIAMLISTAVWSGKIGAKEQRESKPQDKWVEAVGTLVSPWVSLLVAYIAYFVINP